MSEHIAAVLLLLDHENDKSMTSSIRVISVHLLSL
jgi:hypothetical protein